MAIDVGYVPANLGGALSCGGATCITLDNPANANGILDTVRIWAQNDLADVTVGTYYFVSGTTYTCRASVYLGAVTGGAERTFSGKSITVVTGDFIGMYVPVSNFMEYWNVGGAGVMRIYAEKKDPGDSGVYSVVSATGMISLYGTGVESGWSKKIFGVTPVKIFGIAKANIKKVNGV